MSYAVHTAEPIVHTPQPKLGKSPRRVPLEVFLEKYRKGANSFK